jgi:hypothetical protein
VGDDRVWVILFSTREIVDGAVRRVHLTPDKTRAALAGSDTPRRELDAPRAEVFGTRDQRLPPEAAAPTVPA